MFSLISHLVFLFFELKKLFICQTTSVTVAQSLTSHNKVHGARQEHVIIVRVVFEEIQPVNFFTLTCLMKTAIIDEFKRKQLENIDEKGYNL